MQEQFHRRFDAGRSVDPVYTVEGEDRERVCVPRDEGQRAELRKAKRVQRGRGSLKEELMEAPQELFDPEIGEYRPRFYPFVSPYKSEWIPGILVEDGYERRRVPIQTQVELDAFRAVINEADRTQREEVEYHGVRIPKAAARQVADVAER